MSEELYCDGDWCNPPDDFRNPDFANPDKVHDWKNYTSENIENYWPLFSEWEKAIIAEMLQSQADSEEWD